MHPVTIDGVRVACTVAGTGRPIAMLHCSGSSAAQWRDLAARLRAHRVIAPDFYGCGSTGPWPGRAAIRLADHVRLVEEVVHATGEPVHLVGHSFGGAVALRLALEHPNLLRSMVLIEPVAFHLLRHDPADRPHYAEIRTVASTVFACMLNGHSHAGMARFVNYWSRGGAWAALAPAVQERLAGQIAGVAANFTALFADRTPPEAYRAVAVPTLVLRGSESPHPARRAAELVARALPCVRLETVGGAGHMMPLTHPDAVAQRLLDHFARLELPGASAA